MKDFKIIEWLSDRIKIIDQVQLPHKEVFVELRDYQGVADAIKELRIRGAPDIGVAAAYGFALGAQAIKASSKEDFLAKLRPVTKTLASSRPTAVNLFWALERMNRTARSGKSVLQIKKNLIAEAKRIDAENDEANRRLSELGAELILEHHQACEHIVREGHLRPPGARRHKKAAWLWAGTIRPRPGWTASRRRPWARPGPRSPAAEHAGRRSF